jgi:hypothetical protein
MSDPSRKHDIIAHALDPVESKVGPRRGQIGAGQHRHGLCIC